MSRSGYSDDLDQWSLIRWRGQVASSIRGKRGQAFLREMLAALDAMPEKRLIAFELESDDGAVCALGCIGRARGIPLPKVAANEWDLEDAAERQRQELADALGIAHQLVAEIEFMNDDSRPFNEAPEHRWQRMRNWVVAQIIPVGQ